MGGGQQTRLQPPVAWLNAHHHAAFRRMPGLPQGVFRLAEAQGETAAFWGWRLEAESSGEVRDIETLLEQEHKREEKILTHK